MTRAQRLKLAKAAREPTADSVDGCLSCPFVHQSDETMETWCAHPKWSDLTQWTKHGGLRPLKIRTGKHTYPPKWCPLRMAPTLVTLSKKGLRS